MATKKPPLTILNFVKDGYLPRCHLVSQNILRTYQDTNISLASDVCPNVTEYSEHSKLSLHRKLSLNKNPVPLTVPSAAHCDILLLCPFSASGLSVSACDVFTSASSVYLVEVNHNIIFLVCQYPNCIGCCSSTPWRTYARRTGFILEGDWNSHQNEFAIARHL